MGRAIRYLRLDIELLTALAIPSIAATDIFRRTGRVEFHQVFTYASSQPSFVPAVDGEAAADIVSIRAAIVVVNHFFISAAALVFIPPIVQIATSRQSLSHKGAVRRMLLRSAATVVVWVWCIVATKPLYCGGRRGGVFSNLDWDVGGSCGRTNGFLWVAASFSEILPWASCGSASSAGPAMAIAFVMASGVLSAFMQLGGIGGFFGGWLAVFITLYLAMLLLPNILGSLIGFLYVNIWYFWTEGRRCTFGPSDSIGSSEMDQICGLIIGVFLGSASIWESISSVRRED